MWQSLNPSFEFEYFCDEEMNEWIKNNTSTRSFECFNSLNTGAGRADFYRIRKLFVEGGIWFDADLPPNNILKKVPNLFSILDSHKTAFFVTRKTNEPRFMIMTSHKGNILFEDFEEQMCKEVTRYKQSKEFIATIDITGPKAFHRCLCKYLNYEKISELKTGNSFNNGNISFTFIEDIVDYNQQGDPDIKYKGYRKDLEYIGVTHHKFENAYK